MKLILVRHLATSFSIAHRVCGRLDCPLLPEQKLVIPPVILKDVQEASIKIFSSPMKRCLETASILQVQTAVSDIITIPELAERDWGPLSGMTKVQVKEFFGMEISQLRNNHPQIESDMQLQGRIKKGLALILSQAEEVSFIVSHQGCLRTIVQFYGNDAGKFMEGEFRIIDI